ncbi:MAG: exodeoxyribonuclease VII large subunit [Candidatus Omnitrophota bacterium]
MENQISTRVYTVTEITKNIKILLENNFPAIWIEGEISNLRVPVSGHVYCTLKDKDAQLAAVLFRNSRNLLKFELKDGLNVTAFGRISLYEPRGSYQLYIEKIEPKGIGALSLAFDQLKKKLEAEGLFDKKKKKPIPLLPESIGIVTSKTGAAIQDILNVLNRRFANVNIILRPVKVQGDGAAEEIACALKEFNEFSLQGNKKVDVIIAGRGGGSIEDLWAFNEEVVARAIYKSKIPVISAVGHEIDFTIADFVADLRAPTPSAAAELVIANKEHLIKNTAHLSSRLRAAVMNIFRHKLKTCNSLKSAYIFRNPQNKVSRGIEKMDDIAEELRKAVEHYSQGKEQRLKIITASMNSLNPLAVLSRGYSASFLLPDKKVITRAQDLKPRDEVLTKLKQGSFVSIVKEIMMDKEACNDRD